MTAFEPANAAMMPGTGSVDPLVGLAAGERDPKKVAAEFAGFFYSTMVKEMEESVPHDPYFGGNAEETFRSLWVSQMGRMMGSRQGDPLAGTIQQAIEKQAATAAYGGKAK